MMRQWYAIHTRSGYESKVASSLARKGFETYVPQIRHMGRSKHFVVEQQLLCPGSLFVKATQEESTKILIADVLGYVYWHTQPAVFRDRDVELLSRFINQHADILIERIPVRFDLMPALDKQDRVEGDVPNGGKKIELLLPALGVRLLANERKTSVTTETKLVREAVVINNTLSPAL